ncbi:MAG: superoxide dismutase [Luteolibacter sp.]
MSQHYTINRRQFARLSSYAAVAGAVAPSLIKAAPVTTQKLPALPYDFAALEPHIDARTMEIHHGKHHAGYVKNLNAALEKAPALASKPLEELLSDLPSVTDESLRTALRNNGGGHWNHTLFWETLAPADKTSKVSEALTAAINGSFGSMDAFKQTMTDAAAKRFGSGWAWLIYRDGKLAVTSTPNQDNPLMKGLVPENEIGTPILGIDVWEHAYYLHYQNRRADYLVAWWNVIHWAAVSERFAALTQ